MARGPIPDFPADRPKVPDVERLVDAYLSRPENEMGGSLHIVLEDHNLGRSHIEWCRDRARESGDADGEMIARLLLAMTPTQRRRVCG